MPVNKKALTRYLTYDRCLNNKGASFTWKQLLKYVNDVLVEEGFDPIGKTQFYNDIKYMKSSNLKAPIVTKEVNGNNYYKYSDAGYSIMQRTLDDTETVQLKIAIEVLSKFQGVPQFDFINELIPALESKLGLVKLDKPVMSFENNLDYEGVKFLGPLFNAIVNNRTLSIKYQPFKKPQADMVLFHPYYLKQFNARWFVFGLNEANQNSYWNLALDRIKGVTESDQQYLKSVIDWEEYFFDFIGVSKMASNEPVNVVLLFTEDQAPYVLTKPIHPTQRVKNLDTGLEVTIQVIPNYELEKLVLSFGDSVKVLEPESLVKLLKERLEKAIGHYLD